MPFADPLFRQLDDVHHLHALRAAIMRTLRRQLRYRRGALDEWETVHFTNAIRALSSNMHSREQPTTAWLRLCMVDIETALLLPTDRFGPCQVRRAADNLLSFEALLDAPGTLPSYEELLDTLDALEEEHLQTSLPRQEVAVICEPSMADA
jgi:hypothetical protein